MALTLEELKERLGQLDELILLEVLELEAVDIVNRFDDVVLNKFEDLEEQLEDKYYGK